MQGLAAWRSTASSPSHGLRTDVVQTSNGYWFPEAVAAGEGVLADPFVSSAVNHPVGTVAWSGFPAQTWGFAVRWSGFLHVRTSGSYTFFLHSDDGSRLFLDASLVLSNGGFHTMLEMQATVDLVAGAVPLVIDYFQGWGTFGIIFSWQGPDSGYTKQVVPWSVLTTEVNELGEFDCEVSCGSEGEVANDPVAGHQFNFPITADWLLSDFKYDNRHWDRIGWESGKAATWVMLALQAPDQLRQRVAWALSQIFVVSTQDVGMNHLNELWTNYYDIFVRGAFGNFLDILREVTFSPIMGVYLTHSGSTSYDHDFNFPNENYAREVMQLFTIGTQKLNVDGTSLLVNGEVVPTYDNSNILTFARVFTGFNHRGPRRNTEFSTTNDIDPMGITASVHDKNPKADLDGNYLGDGLPLCEDLPPFSWLSAGARYEYHGKVSAEETLTLSTTSSLFKKFCDGDVSSCDMPVSLTLDETLSCSGDECGHSSVAAVRIGSAIFQYLPECIYFHFNEGLPNRTSGRSVTKGAGFCEAGGARLWDGRVELDTNNVGDSVQRQAECLAKCEAFGGTGCELVTGQSWGNGCYGHTREDVSVGSAFASHWCWTFYDNAAADAGYVGLSYVAGPANSLCNSGAEIKSYVECRRVAQSLGLPLGTPAIGGSATHTWPPEVLQSWIRSSVLQHWRI